MNLLIPTLLLCGVFSAVADPNPEILRPQASAAPSVAAREKVNYPQFADLRERDIIRTMQKLTIERIADPAIPPRLLLLGDSLCNFPFRHDRAYSARNKFFPDHFGQWSALGLFYTPLFGGDVGTDRTVWPMEPVRAHGTHRKLTSTSTDIRSSYNGTLNLDCDEITVYYVTEATAGSFDFQIGPASDSYVKQGATIDASAGAPGSGMGLGVAIRSFQRAKVKVNFAHRAGGEVKILATVFKRTFIPGPEFYLLAEGGKDIEHWDDVESAIIRGVIADIDPHGVLFTVADTPAQVSRDLPGLISLYNGYAADRQDQAEWILIPRPTWGSNNNEYLAAQKDQAKALRAVAQSTGHSFIDIKPAFGEQPMTDGLMQAGDNVHPIRPEGVVAWLEYVFGRLNYLQTLPQDKVGE